MSVVEDIILFGDRVVIPDKLTKFAVNQLYLGHPGIGRMKNLARLYFFWSKMDKEIELAVKWLLTNVKCFWSLQTAIFVLLVQTIKNSLDSLNNLTTVVSAYNYTPHRELDGRTPAKVFFGRKVKTPLDIFRPIKAFPAGLTATQTKIQ